MLQKLVEIAERSGASDIHVMCGRHATFRIKGELIVYTNGPVFDEVLMYEIYDGLGLSREELELNKGVDAGCKLSDSRLRIHFYMTVDGLALSVRMISNYIPKFEDLHLPEVLKTFIQKRTGLVIVTGATGSGKSTTMASLVNYLNQTESKRIITVEDPIEYEYKDDKSLIVQREVGRHVKSFDQALVQAMREDPDVLLVGELRDLDTIQSALRMAETGHLVFGTLHTRGAAESFNRILDVFPGNQQAQVRTQLATVTQGVISQHLVTTAEGVRLPLCEVLVMNSGARGIVSSASGNMSQLKDNIHNNHMTLQSQSFVQSAASLIKQGLMSVTDVKDVFDEVELDKLKKIIGGR